MLTAIGFGMEIVTDEDAFKRAGSDFGDMDILDEDKGFAAELAEMG
jgi:hypothetical protein